MWEDSGKDGIINEAGTGYYLILQLKKNTIE
jgi:hypothetical protein